MYRGRRYYISARQLGCPETKDASLHAANEWWRNKQAELDLSYRASLPPPRPPSPAEDVVAALYGDGTSGDWHQQFADLLDRVTGQIPGWNPPHRPTPGEVADAAEDIRRMVLKELIGKLLEGGPLPPQLAERLPPARVSQVESAVKDIRGDVPQTKDTSASALADTWHKSQEYLVTAGGLRAHSLYQNGRRLQYFLAFVGGQRDATSLDAETLESFHNYCLSKIAEEVWSPSYAKGVFKAARQWIRWLVERGTLTAPANLYRQFRFGPTAKTIQTWTAEEVGRIVPAATGKLKLALLLMLNCGFTQQDVADLRDDEVDWQAGRIIRKRSKTRGQANVPEVNYLLWPETAALLREHRSGGEQVLQTKSGRPLVSARLTDGRTVRYDLLGTLYRRFRSQVGFDKPLKQLRKTGATLLESHPTYGRLTALYLGHAPASLKDRHYAAPPQELFDEAITWLGQQLGQVPEDKPTGRRKKPVG